MQKKNFFLILLAILAMLSVSFAAASAQEIDVDSMDNEQLTELLQQILSKLQQEEDLKPETEVISAAAETPVPAADPAAIEEVIRVTIYENKKLMVEALPGYMFIQPAKDQKQDQETQPEKGSEHYPGEICAPDLACDVVDGKLENCHPYRTWELINGEWMCPAG